MVWEEEEVLEVEFEEEGGEVRFRGGGVSAYCMLSKTVMPTLGGGPVEGI